MLGVSVLVDNELPSTILGSYDPLCLGVRIEPANPNVLHGGGTFLPRIMRKHRDFRM